MVKTLVEEHKRVSDAGLHDEEGAETREQSAWCHENCGEDAVALSHFVLNIQCSLDFVAVQHEPDRNTTQKI